VKKHILRRIATLSSAIFRQGNRKGSSAGPYILKEITETFSLKGLGHKRDFKYVLKN
jgi:hypothetical protein